MFRIKAEKYGKCVAVSYEVCAMLLCRQGRALDKKAFVTRFTKQCTALDLFGFVSARVCVCVGAAALHLPEQGSSWAVSTAAMDKDSREADLHPTC